MLLPKTLFNGLTFSIHNKLFKLIQHLPKIVIEKWITAEMIIMVITNQSINVLSCGNWHI